MASLTFSFSSSISHSPSLPASPSSITPSYNTHSSLPTSPALTPPAKWHCTVLPYSPGDLGKFALAQASLLADQGWQRFFYDQQRSTALATLIHSIPHPAAEYLTCLAFLGVPLVTTNTPWTLQHRDAIHARGPHRSATVDYAELLLVDNELIEH